ncbi:hypothetical protein WS62_01885 [Burkholderia sp. ABCPW 14]|nr:hypothetical protein WS62_01885 [Burkholderia sp. ABCPW 14]
MVRRTERAKPPRRRSRPARSVGGPGPVQRRYRGNAISSVPSADIVAVPDASWLRYLSIANTNASKTPPAG